MYTMGLHITVPPLAGASHWAYICLYGDVWLEMVAMLPQGLTPDRAQDRAVRCWSLAPKRTVHDFFYFNEPIPFAGDVSQPETKYRN